MVYVACVLLFVHDMLCQLEIGFYVYVRSIVMCVDVYWHV